jgi:hypothetical protein
VCVFRGPVFCRSGENRPANTCTPSIDEAIPLVSIWPIPPVAAELKTDPDSKMATTLTDTFPNNLLHPANVVGNPNSFPRAAQLGRAQPPANMKECRDAQGPGHRTLRTWIDDRAENDQGECSGEADDPLPLAPKQHAVGITRADSGVSGGRGTSVNGREAVTRIAMLGPSLFFLGLAKLLVRKF